VSLPGAAFGRPAPSIRSRCPPSPGRPPQATRRGPERRRSPMKPTSSSLAACSRRNRPDRSRSLVRSPLTHPSGAPLRRALRAEPSRKPLSTMMESSEAGFLSRTQRIASASSSRGRATSGTPSGYRRSLRLQGPILLLSREISRGAGKPPGALARISPGMSET